jgi:hypothetical protein
MTTQHHQKIAFDDLKLVLLVKEWNSFHLPRKKLDYLYFKDLFKYKCELHLKQPLTPPQRKIMMLTASQITSLSLKLSGNQLSLSLKIIDHVTRALMM